MHFSGHTDKLWDVHAGFLTEKKDLYKQEVVRNALKQVDIKYQPKDDVYVALEIGFTDLEKSKREIEAFRNQYL